MNLPILIQDSINLTQYLGLPLYLINRDYYYAYMSITKQFFGIVLNTITQWFAPTIMRVSWDSSLRDEFKLTKDGHLETRIPERLILIAPSNHPFHTEAMSQAKPYIVIVPGAWHSPVYFQELTAVLEKAGYPAKSIQLQNSVEVTYDERVTDITAMNTARLFQLDGGFQECTATPSGQAPDSGC